MPASKGYALNRQDGEAFWFLGSLMTLKVSGTQSQSGLTLLEQTAPEGFAPPLHVHHQDDEVFYVVEGEMRVFCGDDEWALSAGGLAYLPREVPHAFLITQGPSRILQVTAPSGFEQFMRALSTPAATRELPSEPPDMDALMAQLPHWTHYTEILGPPPTA